MIKKFIILCIVFFPTVVFGATTIESIVVDIGLIIQTATPIVVALALIFFFYGLAKYILNASDEEKKKEGRAIMIWGIIALFVIVSVWGLVRVIGNTFNIDREQTITVPFVL